MPPGNLTSTCDTKPFGSDSMPIVCGQHLKSQDHIPEGRPSDKKHRSIKVDKQRPNR